MIKTYNIYPLYIYKKQVLRYIICVNFVKRGFIEPVNNRFPYCVSYINGNLLIFDPTTHLFVKHFNCV